MKLNDETVAFYTNRLQGGVSNRLEVDQAQANRAITASTIPDIERQIALTENALSVLLGRLPGPDRPRDRLSPSSTSRRACPRASPRRCSSGGPTSLQAEDFLVSANADVGAAKALFFPTISLTGLLGGVSHDLSNVVKADGAVWSLGAGVFQPIFQGGRIKRNYEAAKARFDQAIAQYQKAALERLSRGGRLPGHDREAAEARGPSRRRASSPCATRPSSRALATTPGFRTTSRS